MDIKFLRKSKGLTQEQLAELTGLSVNTIQSIELGRRLGSTDTWIKLTEFFNKGKRNVSYSSDDLIEEIKQDIEEFGENEPCYLKYDTSHGYLFFVDYDFILEDKFENEDIELQNAFKDGYIITDLKTALEFFEIQNKIID